MNKEEAIELLIKRTKRDVRYYKDQLKNAEESIEAIERLIQDREAWVVLLESFKT